ncbi:MAG: AI-2E family transporter [Paracoccaceae bacterium]
MENQPQPTETGIPNNLAFSRQGIALISLAVATIGVTVVFIEVIRPFLSALVLAAICAALAKPVYNTILGRVGNRKGLASGITVLLGIVSVVAPLGIVGYLAALQATGLMEGTGQFLESLSGDVEALKKGTFAFPEWVPFREKLAAAGPQVIEKMTQIMGSVATVLISALSGLTNGTASFFLSMFTFLYAMFYFLPLKVSTFQSILHHSGLDVALQEKLHDRIISVSRATLKGTLLIGAIQGAFGGFGFWMAGIEGVAFWSVVMAIAAAIPGLGATAVVIAGAIYLVIQGAIPAAIGLGLWAILVVGTIDNVLRPSLVGREAQMGDLMIFISTLGGLALFGATGLIFGPVIAGVFFVVWEAVSQSSLRPDHETDG